MKISLFETGGLVPLFKRKTGRAKANSDSKGLVCSMGIFDPYLFSIYKDWPASYCRLKQSV